jgi:hypothetical protein
MSTKGKISIYLMILFFMISLALPAQADVRLTQIKLTSKKINLAKFAIANLSGDGRILTGIEKVDDPRLKQKGMVYRLWLIEFQGDDREKVTFSDILLPITEFQQMSLSDDGGTALITANRGTKFLKVDIASKKASVIFEHKNDSPGFRSDMGMIYYFKDRFCIWGYFYDKNKVEKERGMTTLDLSKNGCDMFNLAFNTAKFEKKYMNSKYTEWVSPSQCFIIGKKPSEKINRTLALYDAGTLKDLDSARNFKGAAASDGRVVYFVEREKEKYETILKDPAQGKTWKLTAGAKPYSYAFVSRNGQTVIISMADIKQNKMSYFYAAEKDDFKIKPVNALQGTPLSVLRLAPYGRHYVTFNGSEIYWGKLE